MGLSEVPMMLRAALLSLLTLSLAAADKPKVKFETSLGSFTMELEPEAAPKTVENFLGYVRKGFYNGTIFHRVIKTFMVQGGGHLPDMTKKPTGKPIAHEGKEAFEKGLRNLRGSVAMARTGDPNSATAQFFVNTVDNAFLDYPGQDGYGYTVFAKVVEGMETIDKIRDVPTTKPGDVPKEPVLITGAAVVGEKAPAPKGKKAPAKKAQKK